MESQRPTFSVIEGRPDAPIRIALSLVHRRERIDIPVRDVLQIDTRADETFYFPELRASRTYPCAHVKLTLKPDVRGRLYRLTRDIVGDPLEILVAGEVISSPIVREPLGIQESFNIHVFDFAEAKEIAEKLRKGWINGGLRFANPPYGRRLL
jgi:hypothetical protein